MESRISYSNQYLNISNWLHIGKLSTNPNILYENEEKDNELCREEYCDNTLRNDENFEQNLTLINPEFSSIEMDLQNPLENALMFETNWDELEFCNRFFLNETDDENFPFSKFSQNEWIDYEHQMTPISLRTSSDNSSLQEYTNLIDPCIKNKTQSTSSTSGISTQSELSSFLYSSPSSSTYFYCPEESRSNSTISSTENLLEQKRLDVEVSNEKINEQIRRNKEICWILSPIRKYKVKI